MVVEVVIVIYSSNHSGLVIQNLGPRIGQKESDLKMFFEAFLILYFFLESVELYWNSSYSSRQKHFISQIDIDRYLR